MYLADMLRNVDILRLVNVIAYYINEHVTPLPYLIIKDIDKTRLLHVLSEMRPTSP